MAFGNICGVWKHSLSISLVLFCLDYSSSFVTRTDIRTHRNRRRFTQIVPHLLSEDGTATAAMKSNNPPDVPVSFNEMVGMVSRAVVTAYDQGITRQIIRVLLPRDGTSGDLGVYFEDDAQTDMRGANLILVPPDESWQGGIMQLYRAASPTCVEILRGLSKNEGGIPPRLIEDRSIDESGVDGVGLWMMQSSVSPEEDASCFVQPTQEILDSIENISAQAGERLVLLLNPQWRNADDALDAASKGDGLLGGLASFLGGKGGSLRRLDEMGYKNVFTLEGYVCKGGNIRLMKQFDSDWYVFAENDAGTNFIYLGTAKMRPTYQDCEKMMDEKGIGIKYARDMGLAPKL